MTSCAPTSCSRSSSRSGSSRASRPATRFSSSCSRPTEVPIPEGIVEAEVHSHLEGENRLEDDEHRAEVDESTRKALRAQLLLDAIVEKEEIRVEQPELIEYIVMSAQQYGMDPNEFAQNIDQQGQVPAMVAEVARRKALAYVLEQASVVDTDGTVIDLDAAVPQSESEAEGDAESEFDTEVVEVTAEDAPADEDATAKA